MKSVSIITVNYNGEKHTEAFLASCLSHHSQYSFECIVVDNGSFENPVDQWQLEFPAVKFVRSDVNLGFSGGNNLGIALAQGEFLFLVNNDTVFTEGLIDKLVEQMTLDSQWGILCPLILYFDDPKVLQFAGYTQMNYFTCRNATLGMGELDSGQFGANPYETAFVHGAAMFVRRSALLSVGMMPENYFLYFEEFDWSEMFKRSNWKLGVVPSARILHKESMSVGKLSSLKAYFMTRNRLLFIRRNAKVFQRVFFLFYFVFLGFPKSAVVAMLAGHPHFIRQYWRALIWNLSEPTGSRTLGFKN